MRIKMNLSILLKKAPLVFFIILCFVISLNHVEANKTIRIRRVKQAAPRHIAISARSGNGVYARRYAYGRPIPGYNIRKDIGGVRRNFNVRKRRNGRGVNRTYASRYKNWTPNGPRGRVDRVNRKKRKELLPFLQEPQFGGNKHKRRIRPQRINAMQRPQPPKPDFDEDYFFPEEERRAQFDRQRPKNRRRPEKVKKPDLFSKIPYYDEKPFRDREPTSYSSFQQRPGDETDDEDSESGYSQPVKKKKRVKKKKKKIKNKDEHRPFVFENDQVFESYPPFADDYEAPKKNKKRNKPSYDADEDEFVPSKNPYYSKPPQNVFRFDSEYKGTQTQTQFNPSYSSSWSQVVETTARPVQPIQYQTEHGFQPQYSPTQHTPQYSFKTNVQKTKQATNTQTYYSQPDNTYKGSTYSNNYLSNNQPSTNVQTYNYNSYSNSVYSNPSPTYSQPVASNSPVLSDITIQKSVPIYDNTETFYNYNNNAYVNSQSPNYYTPAPSTKYNNQEQKFGTRIPSYSKPIDKDPDSDFIKNHQNLYNKGLSGVPIQGDGYAKESVKKDYDIGYGDFQFDENTN